MSRRLHVLARWSVAGLFGLAVAWQTKFGPVLFTVSARHGVHLGDLVGFALGGVWAVLGDPARSRRTKANDANR